MPRPKGSRNRNPRFQPEEENTSSGKNKVIPVVAHKAKTEDVTNVPQFENLGILVTWSYVCKRTINPPQLIKVLTSSLAQKYFKDSFLVPKEELNPLSVAELDLEFKDAETFLYSVLKESKSPDGFIDGVRTNSLRELDFLYRGLLAVNFSVCSTPSNTLLTTLCLTVACQDGTYEITIPYEKE